MAHKTAFYLFRYCKVCMDPKIKNDLEAYWTQRCIFNRYFFFTQQKQKAFYRVQFDYKVSSLRQHIWVSKD